MATNFLPKVEGIDQAIWTRIRVLPFNHPRPKSTQDRFIRDKFMREAPGILNWMLEGWRDWNDNGFIEPEGVLLATTEYKEENDTFADWFAEEMVIREGSSVSASILYSVYKNWCDLHRLKVQSQKVLGKWLSEKGYPSVTNSTGRKEYRGITIWDAGYRRTPPSHCGKGAPG